MSTRVLHYLFTFTFILFSFSLFAQPGPDCVEAEVICSDGAIAFNPQGIGMDDFANPNNDAGCMSSDEQQSAWYYFEFQASMPPNSVIEFTVNPDGGSGEDYDFAIFGPNVECDNLGFPIRCSYASSSCSFCPQTGLGMGASDNSEGAGGDGFVSGLTVQPGEGYYLLMDNFLGTSTGFTMDWGGDAAPFLNCDATPGCDLVVTVGPDIEGCINGGSFVLSSTVSGNIDPVTYNWTAIDGTGQDYSIYIVDPFSPNPTVNLPPDFEGTITFTLTVTEPTCEEIVSMNFSTLPAPPVSGYDLEFCDGGAEFIAAVGNFQSYLWSTGEMTQGIVVDASGVYTVTVTDNNGCEGVATFNITEHPPLFPVIMGQDSVCFGSAASFEVTGLDIYFAGLYTWSTGVFGQSITVTEPGLYTVTVTDLNGCEATAEWEVFPRVLAPFSIDAPDEICANTSAELIVNGNFEGYFWDNGGVGQTLTIYQAGTYEVTVSDASGCAGIQSVTVDPAIMPNPMIIGNTTLCTGDTMALIVDNAYQSYIWSEGSDQSTLQVTEEGTYAVIVTANNGCIGTDEIMISEETPVISISGPAEFCEGDSIVLQADGLTTNYLWSNGETSQSITVSESGVYSVSIESDGGCIALDTLEVIMHQNPTVAILGNLAICPDGATVLSTDQPFSTYNWSTTSTDANISASTPGIYTVTVTDGNTCEASAQVEVIEENELTIDITGDIEICEGENSLFELGGIYSTYIWSTGEETASIESGTAGEISVSVTDEFGCFGETSVQLLVNDLPDVNISGAETFCNGLSSILDAGNFLTYEWQDGSDLQNFEANQTGTYAVTVTDANGCVNNTSLLVEELPLLIPEILGDEQFCPQTTTTLTGEDGFATYEWTGGETSQNISVDNPGTYTLNVTDEFGCEGVNNIALTNFALEDPQITGIPNFCPGENTLLSTTQSFEAYSWSNGTATQTNLINASGDYTLEVTDINGCITSSQISIDEYPTSIPDILGPVGLCLGNTTTLSAENGFVTYQWDAGSNLDEINVDAAGTYTLTVTDNNACQTSNSFELLEYALPVVDIEGPTTFCTGFYTTLVSNAAFEEYLWSTGDVTSTLQANIEGAYSLTATDINGCQNEATTMINEAAQLSPEITGPLFFCENESTTLDAGIGFATYTWSDNSTEQTLIANAPGLYSVSVTDAGGCAGEIEVNVIENPLPVPVISGIFEFCEGNNTLLDVGNLYETYQWDSGEEVSSITVNAPGAYGLTVTNQFGCEASDVVSVLERPLPVFSILGQDFFCENESTTVNVDASFSDYNWTNGGVTQAVDISSAGLLGLTVTNEFGCQDYEEINIEEIPRPIANSGDDEVLNCDKRSIVLNGDIDNDLGYQYTYLWSGTGIASSDITLSNPTVETEGLYSLVITDEDHNCQSLPVEVSITDLAYQPEIELIVLDTLDCVTETVRVEASVSVSGSDIHYQWFNHNRIAIPGATEDYYIATNAEEYFFEIFDDLTRCIAEDSVEVAANNLYPIANAGEPAHLDCITTAVILDASGSEEGFFITYQWETTAGNIISNSSTLTPEINAPGTYLLTVSDTLNGCENISEVTVTQDIIPPNAEAGENQQLDCHNETATLTGSSTTSNLGIPVSFEWFLTNNNQVLSNQYFYTASEQGAYNLVVTNLINGCTNEDEVVINLDDSFPTDMNLDFENPTCFGDDNGIVFVENVAGGAQPLLYSIDRNPFISSTNFANLPAGEYLITVQDINGCEYSETIFLEDGNDLLLDLGEDIFIDLGETADINAYVNVNPDDLVSISWQSPDSLNCVDANCLSFATSPSITTNYQVTIADDNGCVRSEDITVFVNKPRDVFIPNVFSPNGDGNNDVAMIFAGRGVKTIQSFLIFNRWGEPVFEVYNFPPNDPAFGWDGHYRSATYNSAVFTYFAEVEFIDGEVILFKGSVTLMK